MPSAMAVEPANTTDRASPSGFQLPVTDARSRSASCQTVRNCPGRSATPATPTSIEKSAEPPQTSAATHRSSTCWGIAAIVPNAKTMNNGPGGW